MESKNDMNVWGYVLSASLGALAGGLSVLIIGRVFPTMMSNMMANMMAQMSASGCDPEDM